MLFHLLINATSFQINHATSLAYQSILLFLITHTLASQSASDIERERENTKDALGRLRREEDAVHALRKDLVAAQAEVQCTHTHTHIQ